MKTRLYYTFVVGTAIALSNMRVPAHLQNQPVATAVTDSNAPTPAQRALALLKPTADKLSAAGAFTFKTHSMVEVPSPAGHMRHYFLTSEVAVERPNKLVAKQTGEGAACHLYYDGKKFSGVNKKLGLYAQMDAPPTFDELVPLIAEKTGIYFPPAEMLYSDVYASLTKDLTYASWVDKSTEDGVTCDHLAFAGPGVERQIWVGTDNTLLTRRLMTTRLPVEGQPRFMVTFSDWDLNPSLSAGHFEFRKPGGAKQIEFRALMTKSYT